MKSIKEKQLLVKWSKAMNEPIDPALVEEVERYEQIQRDIIDSVRSNSIKDLQEASVVAEKFVEKINIDYPKPPTLDEVLQVIQEESKELIETVPVNKKEPKPVTLADKAADHITKEVKLEQASFQQPNPPVVDKNLEAIQKKLKFLEQAIGKIAAHGPGSGEVRFRFLDDIDRNSINDTHKLLRYRPNVNPAFDDFYFDFLSGDQGPVNSLHYDITGYTGNANVAAGLTYYDPERDTLEVLHKDNTQTYVGLDNYIRYKNGTANIISRGSLIQFIGSDLVDNVPLGGPFLANVKSIPLYVMGVSATDCQPNNLSRAILLGELENINSSGSTAGEVWKTGDLLWASPSLPGTLTNVKPTAPNVVVSVAAVLNNSPTTGRLLVRTTIWPRLRSGDFYSSATQIAPNTNFAHQVTFSNTLFTSGVEINANSEVKVSETGLYKFDCRAQLTSTSANQKSIVLWYRKNNVNVPFSSVRQGIATNGGYATITNSQIISMSPQDNVKIFYAVTDTTMFIDSPPILDNSANIPSVQLTVTEPSL